MWSSTGGWLARKTAAVELHWVRDPEGEFSISIGMRKADQELKAAVDRSLMRLVEQQKVEV